MVKPSEVVEISEEELQGYHEAKYRVVGVISYATGPVKNVRILTREGLHDY